MLGLLIVVVISFHLPKYKNFNTYFTVVKFTLPFLSIVLNCLILYNNSNISIKYQII